MKIVLMGQEEPVYFSPFFRSLLKARMGDIVCVVIAGSRGAGSHPKTLKSRLQNLYALWRLFEPKGFIRSLAINCYQTLLSTFGLIGTKLDRRSIRGLAQQLHIPILYTEDVNSPAFLSQLKAYSPDLIINQSEFLLKQPLLFLPAIGVLNRHASLLPKFRGRLGSFWAHAQANPEYGTTIHLVDEQIDSGPIIAQERHSLDPRLSYTEILSELFRRATPLMLAAISALECSTFRPLPNAYHDTPTYRFPSLQQIQAYRKTLKARRARLTAAIDRASGL